MATPRQRKIKHNKRITHQVIAEQRKLDAINIATSTIVDEGNTICGETMLPRMNELGYFFISGKAKDGDTYSAPHLWKRIPNPHKKTRPKVMPS